MNTLTLISSAEKLNLGGRRLLCPEDHPVFYSDIVLVGEPAMEETDGGETKPIKMITWRALANVGGADGDGVEYRTGQAEMLPGLFAPEGSAETKLVFYLHISTETMSVLPREAYSPFDEGEVPEWTLTDFRLGSDPVLYPST